MEAGSAARDDSALARLLSSRARLIPLAIYLAALFYAMWRDGIPMNRDRVLVWILLGLLAFSLSNVRGWLRSVVVDWLPFALILWAYDLLRGQADGLLFDAYFRPQLEADAFLFGGTVPTVWLQEHLWNGSWDLRWYDYASWGVYMSYFVATYLLAAGLWLFARDRFRPYVATVCVLALMGFVTYALFPAAPPWLASRAGELEPTTRTIGLVSGQVPIADFGALFDRGSAYANPVAAVPSLHGAYTLLVALVLWRVTRRLRPLLALYPPAMAFALVYTAEHYLVDVLLGFAYTAVAVALVNAAARRLRDSPRLAALRGDGRKLLHE
jgi:hypothetical protein